MPLVKEKEKEKVDVPETKDTVIFDLKNLSKHNLTRLGYQTLIQGLKEQLPNWWTTSIIWWANLSEELSSLALDKINYIVSNSAPGYMFKYLKMNMSFD